MPALEDADKGVGVPTGTVRTTSKELCGWYLYEVGTAGFFFGTVDFVSVFLVGLAGGMAKRNWCAGLGIGEGDPSFAACMSSYWAKDYERDGLCVGADELRSNSSCVQAGHSWSATWNPEANKVDMFGVRMATQSTFTTAITISVVLQLVMCLTMGAMADYGTLRKKLFVLCNAVAVVCVALIFLGSSDASFELVAALMIVVNTSLNFAMIMYSSWLPLLVKSHPEVLDSAASGVELHLLVNRITTRVQSRATLIAYCGVVVYLLVSASLFIFVAPIISDDLTVRIVCLVCSAWMALFISCTALLLQSRPGPPIPRGKNVCTASLSNMASSLLRLRKSGQASVFFAAYFVYSDGFSTMAGAGAVFAASELHLGFSSLIVAYIASAVMAATAASTLPLLQRRFGWDSKRILIAALLVVGLLPLYAVFAFRSEVEFYVFAGVFGFCQAISTVFGKSIFAASIVPLGRESEYFSLWQLTDKGSAWLGPLVLSIVSTQTGSYRTAFSTLVVFFYIGLGILLFFDAERANEQKSRIEEEDRAVGAKLLQTEQP